MRFPAQSLDQHELGSARQSAFPEAPSVHVPAAGDVHGGSRGRREFMAVAEFQLPVLDDTEYVVPLYSVVNSEPAGQLVSERTQGLLPLPAGFAGFAGFGRFSNSRTTSL